jgi:hypothetical protein
VSVALEGLIMQTQAQIADHMAATTRVQQDTNKQIGQTNKLLAEGQIRQAIIEERLITLVEDNSRREIEVSNISGRLGMIEQKVGVNDYARTAFPQILLAIAAACGATGSLVWLFASKTIGSE